ncbi:hypothetical protein IE81DRAFT_326554 [Ceraceosorus guamensis]|uniref:Secreted protein n=1 Tax=Ceraceosorus guamensis TaxID=1522189 RepID=A0A316VT79_9BASI|nr:hypothetical protein IE81DRAFT_326554 [Ceraceosorus guamensis]PWN39421.1 hypothetical protein IE81DRAFT_326554 [Ceraceosorus guamensis]
MKKLGFANVLMAAFCVRWLDACSRVVVSAGLNRSVCASKEPILNALRIHPESSISPCRIKIYELNVTQTRS